MQDHNVMKMLLQTALYDRWRSVIWDLWVRPPGSTLWAYVYLSTMSQITRNRAEIANYTNHHRNNVRVLAVKK